MKQLPLLTLACCLIITLSSSSAERIALPLSRSLYTYYTPLLALIAKTINSVYRGLNTDDFVYRQTLPHATEPDKNITHFIHHELMAQQIPDAHTIEIKVSSITDDYCIYTPYVPGKNVPRVLFVAPENIANLARYTSNNCSCTDQADLDKYKIRHEGAHIIHKDVLKGNLVQLVIPGFLYGMCKVLRKQASNMPASFSTASSALIVCTSSWLECLYHRQREQRADDAVIADKKMLIQAYKFFISSHQAVPDSSVYSLANLYNKIYGVHPTDKQRAEHVQHRLSQFYN